MPPLTLLVMAAGVGRRYGGLKQVAPVGPDGETILDYSLYDAIHTGFDRFVFVVSQDIQPILQERIERSIGRELDTAFVVQSLTNLPLGYSCPSGRVKPWGTGHAVLSCRKLVDSPFAVINADDFYGRRSFEKLAACLETTPARTGPPLYCLVIYRLENTLTAHGHVARAICSLDEQGCLLGLVERTSIERTGGIISFTLDDGTRVSLPADTPVSMNLWGFTPAVFTDLEAEFTRFLDRPGEDLLEAEYFLPEALNTLLSAGKAAVQTLTTEDRWFGVTYQADKIWVSQEIRRLIETGAYPETLWG